MMMWQRRLRPWQRFIGKTELARCLARKRKLAKPKIQRQCKTKTDAETKKHIGDWPLHLNALGFPEYPNGKHDCTNVNINRNSRSRGINKQRGQVRCKCGITADSKILDSKKQSGDEADYL